MGESQAILTQLILVVAVESRTLGGNEYDGCRNALELRPTCQTSCRGNIEASPEVSWEFDQCEVTTKDRMLSGQWRPCSWVAVVVDRG